LLVADEPTARQDVIIAAAITDLLRTMSHNGCAVIVVSHDRPWMATLTHRLLRVDNGRLLR
jgi:ABC-type ATPase involved in cell division